MIRFFGSAEKINGVFAVFITASSFNRSIVSSVKAPFDVMQQIARLCRICPGGVSTLILNLISEAEATMDYIE